LPAGLPVVIYSGNTHKRLVTQCIALDVSGFIVKPVSVDALRKRLADLRMTQAVARGGDYYQGVVSGMIAGMGDAPSVSAMRLLAPASDTYQGESAVVESAPSATGAKLGYLNWNDRYSVHDNAMDSDHRRILGLINDAFLLYSDADGQGGLSDIAAKLYQYTVDHFAAEEAMLRRVAYPKLAEHLELHRSMTQQTREILLRIEALESNVERDVFQFLKEWWLVHIQTADKAYGDYLLAPSPST
jgi:hemerythrin-like metal-binding protein